MQVKLYGLFEAASLEGGYQISSAMTQNCFKEVRWWRFDMF